MKRARDGSCRGDATDLAYAFRAVAADFEIGRPEVGIDEVGGGHEQPAACREGHDPIVAPMVGAVARTARRVAAPAGAPGTVRA